MKKLLFLITLFSPFILIAQNQSSFDIMAGPTLGYRTLSTSSSDEIVQMIIDSRNERELTNISFTVGVNYNQSISKKWYLRSGVRFSRINYFTAIEDGMWPSQHDGAGGFNPNLPGEEVPDKIKYNHSFIDVAILARRNFSEKKWAPFVELGVAPNFLLNADEVAFPFAANKIQVAAIISGGIQYTPNSNFQFFAQPAWRFHVVKVVKDVPISERLLGVSLELGVRKFLGGVAN